MKNKIDALINMLYVLLGVAELYMIQNRGSFRSTIGALLIVYLVINRDMLKSGIQEVFKGRL